MEQDKSNTYDPAVKFFEKARMLNNTLPLNIVSLIAVLAKLQKELKNFIHKKCEVLEESETVTRYKVKDGENEKHLQLQRRIEDTKNAVKILPHSYLLIMVSDYDSFIAGLIRSVFLVKPELLNNSEKVISLAELIKYGSISAGCRGNDRKRS